MLIVRGVNLFPLVVGSATAAIHPHALRNALPIPNDPGVLQTPPLPIYVEVAHGKPTDNPELARRIKDELKARLLVTTDVKLVAQDLESAALVEPMTC